MKKALLVLTILFASVLSTACINNLAIQELNNKAKAYLDAGDVDKAICRYTSSLDIDSSVFETNYNLGVAYVQAKKYDEAIKTLENAISINPSFADSYYSLAVALENQAHNILNEEVSDEASESVDEAPSTDKVISETDKTKASKMIMDSVENYNKYLAANSNASDKDKVLQRIEELNNELIKTGTSKVNNDED